MPIVFIKPLPTLDILLFSENNRFVQFKYEHPIGPQIAPVVKNCTIKVNGTMVTIYANPSDVFLFNFKDIFKVQYDVNKFEDNIDYQQLFFNWSNYYIQMQISIKINFTDNSFFIESFDRYVLNGYQNKFEYYNNGICFINTAKKSINNQFDYLKFWQDYPFDISIFNGAPDGDINKDIYLKIDNDFINLPKAYINRYVICDGFITNAPLYQGINKIALGANSNANFIPIRNLELDVITETCNKIHYIKWLNQYGGWNYWLFNKGDINRSTKQIGSLENDYNNLEETVSLKINVGYNANDNVTVYETVEEKYQPLFSDLFESTKVYLFIGQPGLSSTYLDFIEVTIKDKTNLIQDKRYSDIKYQIDIELPERITRKL